MNEIKSIGGERILTEADLGYFSRIETKLLIFMGDGKWHSASSIIDKSGQREGLRRLRALRKKGYTVERRRIGDIGHSREFAYRIMNSQDHPPEGSGDRPVRN
jgi:hypothetical protein